MATGFLLLSKENDYKTILKRISRVFVPLLGLSFLLYIKDNGINNIDIYHFIVDFIKRPYVVHFWYLYMLIGLYLIIPFIKKMINNFEDKDYKMFILITLILVASVNTFIPSITNYFMQSLFSITIGYLVAGLYLSKIKLDKKYFTISILVYIISFIYIFIEMYAHYIIKNEVLYNALNYQTIFHTLCALSIYYIFRYLFENKKLKYEKLISNISLTTFGIYLIHYFMIYEVYDLSIIKTIFDYNGYIGVVILEVLTFLASCIVIYILKKIPIIKKYL